MKTQALRKYRDSLGVVEEILTIALEGATTSRIVYGANTTFIRFRRYASFLLERGLLETTNMQHFAMC